MIASFSPDVSTFLRTDPLVAPKAMRIPISLVPRATAKATTAYKPATPSRRPMTPVAPTICAMIRDASKLRVECLSHAVDAVNGNIRSQRLNFAPERGRETQRIICRLHEQSHIGAELLWKRHINVGSRQIDGRLILAVASDADDLEHGGSFANTELDLASERIGIGPKAAGQLLVDDSRAGRARPVAGIECAAFHNVRRHRGE